jgi:hypothetical protein
MKRLILIGVLTVVTAGIMLCVYAHSAKEPRWDIIVSSVLVVLGWLFVHESSVYRDILSKYREQRVQILVQAFQNMTRIYHHDSSDGEMTRGVESAFISIQLLGSRERAAECRDFAKKHENAQTVDWESFDNIVGHVRNDLRKEFGLPQIDEKVSWLHIKAKGNG